MDPVLVLADRPFSIADIQATEVLDVRNVGSEVWLKLTSHCVAKELGLYHLLFDSLDRVDNLRSTTGLATLWTDG